MAVTAEQHLAEVLEAYGEGDDARLIEIVQAAIRHLHAFVDEVGLTRDEWFKGIEFLTAVGQMCDEKRQEFILLSDTLGVSTLVEMVNQKGSEGTTEPTVFGPFHVDGAPERERGESIVLDDLGGEALTIAGTVQTLEGVPIGNANLDIWQTAPNGFYDVQDDSQTSMNLRGQFHTDADGSFEIKTVRPVAYPIPGDGPTGDLLNGSNRHNYRPAHIHFVVSAAGYKTVVTHLFDSESAYLDSDAVFGTRPSLIVDMTGGSTEFDFVLEPEPQPQPAV